MPTTDAPQVEVRDLAALRDWLKKHHADCGSVWLVTFKKAHPDYLPFGEVVEELMCWGWVDSSVRTVDDLRVKHLISPRNPASAWSAANKRIVEAMRAAGRMQPSGEALIAAAKKNGMWSFLDDVERLEVPEDLAVALGADRDTWEGWSRSVKRAWLEKIKRAKTEVTREKHVARCADAVRRNLRDGGLRN
ncbi:MAG: YdeI/OmpD-associated family protein [Silicimonas sp.]|nr:YdeI/OmpD-associated family protein [Silicimonas sp.]